MLLLLASGLRSVRAERTTDVQATYKKNRNTTVPSLSDSIRISDCELLTVI